VGGTGGLSAIAVKKLGQQRLKRQKGNANQSCNGMRAIQDGVILHIEQYKATLSAEEEEKESEAHQGWVELAGGLAGKLNLALTVANLPSKIGAEGGHGGQNNAPILHGR